MARYDQRRTLGTHPATAAAQAATLALARTPSAGPPCVLNGILFVLLTGIRWTDLPQQLGYGSGMTCWCRLRAWTQASVWDQLHALLLAELHAGDQIDWTRAAVDASHVRAKRGRTRSDQARSTGPAGQQAPRPDRRDRHPAGRAPDRRQPS
jgi:transposase